MAISKASDGCEEQENQGLPDGMCSIWCPA
jgi:hypothetical protein